MHIITLGLGLGLVYSELEKKFYYLLHKCRENMCYEMQDWFHLSINSVGQVSWVNITGCAFKRIRSTGTEAEGTKQKQTEKRNSTEGKSKRKTMGQIKTVIIHVVSIE